MHEQLLDMMLFFFYFYFFFWGVGLITFAFFSRVYRKPSLILLPYLPTLPT